MWRSPLDIYFFRRFANERICRFYIKEKLDNVLTEMHEYSWHFVNNPEKDFTRNRKLNFKEMLNILLICTIFKAIL